MPNAVLDNKILEVKEKPKNLSLVSLFQCREID